MSWLPVPPVIKIPAQSNWAGSDLPSGQFLFLTSCKLASYVVITARPLIGPFWSEDFIILENVD